MNKELLEKMVKAQLQIEIRKIDAIGKDISELDKLIHNAKLSRSEALKRKNRLLREIDTYLLRVGGLKIDKTNYWWVGEEETNDKDM